MVWIGPAADQGGRLRGRPTWDVPTFRGESTTPPESPRVPPDPPVRPPPDARVARDAQYFGPADLDLAVEDVGVAAARRERPHREEVGEQAEEPDPVVAARDRDDVALRRVQVAVGLLDEEGKHPRLPARVREQLLGGADSSEGARHVDPPPLSVGVQPPDHVHGLETEPELAPESHHLFPPSRDGRNVEREELGEQPPDPARHLVHVVVEVGFVGEVGPPQGPARHPPARVADVPADHRPGGGPH
jgi:hypothetical protein